MMRIVFMGTPDFAVASLKALIENGENVVGVVTAPDRPAGRGQKLRESAVKAFAVAHKIPVMQPEKLRDKNFLEQLANLKADLQVVVAFRMLPEIVWDMPVHGTINVHASLLPQYRGAAPINHAIINGETETGVTTFRLNHEIDTGEILLSKKMKIEPSDNVGTLHDKLMQLGAQALIETVQGIKSNNIKPIDQNTLIDKLELKAAPKIFKEDCLINWEKTCDAILHLIRGLSPYPGAYTFVNNKTLKIFNADILNETHGQTPGSYISDGKTFLRFACKDGYINVSELQIEGKKRMKIDEFLRGNKLA